MAITTNPTVTFVDLDLNFQPNPITGDISKNIGNLAVINALRYLLQTNHYEVPFTPTQGANINKLLFENATPLTAQALQQEIINVVNNYEKRVTIQSINVVPIPNNNTFQVTLTVFILNSVNPVTISLFLKRIT